MVTIGRVRGCPGAAGVWYLPSRTLSICFSVWGTHWEPSPLKPRASSRMVPMASEVQVVGIGDWPGEAVHEGPREEGWKGVLILLQIGFHQALVLVHVQGDHLNVAATLDLFIEPLQMGKFLAAGPAPGGPDVDQGCLSFKTGESPGLAALIGQLEFGNWAVHGRTLAGPRSAAASVSSGWIPAKLASRTRFRRVPSKDGLPACRPPAPRSSAGVEYLPYIRRSDVWYKARRRASGPHRPPVERALRGSVIRRSEFPRRRNPPCC